MTVSNEVPAPIANLPSKLSAHLRQKDQDLLGYIFNANSNTVYFREASPLSAFRTALQNKRSELIEATSSDVQALPSGSAFHAFVETVPLSTYDDYRPFISRFTKSERHLSDVSDLLAPGIPNFVVSSSGTAGGAAKYFLKYRHPPSTSTSAIKAFADLDPAARSTGTYCIVYSLRYADLLDVVDDNAADRQIVSRVPLCLGSVAGFRTAHQWKVENDAELMMRKVPNTTSPLAICFVHSYRTSLLLHALFALEDRSLEMINTLFCTFFFDFIRLIEENWDILVQAIESGVLPQFQGIEEVYECLQAQLRPNPTRAEELRNVGNDTTSAGWAQRLWPNLQRVLGNASGVFSRVVPQVRHYIGPSVSLQSAGLTCSEAWLGQVYDPRQDLNLYKTSSDDVFEYLDISVPDDASHLKRAWEVETGKTYELVLTTRDGFWRYKLGDVVEIAGFDPADGQPIVRYSERRNVMMRAVHEFVTEKELLDAVHSLADTIGDVTEFTVVVDERPIPRAYGFLIELKGRLGPEAKSAPSRLQEFLCRTNDTFKMFSSRKLLGRPTVRLLASGTFRSYREWKAENNPTGGGQVKVPTITMDNKTVSWLLERVVEEV